MYNCVFLNGTIICLNLFCRLAQTTISSIVVLFNKHSLSSAQSTTLSLLYVHASARDNGDNSIKTENTLLITWRLMYNNTYYDNLIKQLLVEIVKHDFNTIVVLKMRYSLDLTSSVSSTPAK